VHSVVNQKAQSKGNHVTESDIEILLQIIFFEVLFQHISIRIMEAVKILKIIILMLTARVLLLARVK